MTSQELEQKFSLIGDPIVRTVVRHLYQEDYDLSSFKESKSAKRVLANSFCWANQILNSPFWHDLYNKLIQNTDYSFTSSELQQVQKAYPELFNADGSLKESDIKGVWRDVYDSSEQKMGKGLDLQKLSDGLERALANETEESLNKFFNEHPIQAVESPRTELNRNEIALKIMCSYINSGSRNMNNENLINEAFKLADAFIKQSKIQ